jgi:long-chain acyl-CoA synthetase
VGIHPETNVRPQNGTASTVADRSLPPGLESPSDHGHVTVSAPAADKHTRPARRINKDWLKEYPEGVPHDIGNLGYASLAELFEDSCRRFRDLPAFSNMGTAMTYAELEQKSRHFAAYLQASRQMRPGDRLAIMLPNLLQYPVVLFGAMRAGLVVVNCNPLYTARELEHQLRDSGTTAIVVFENAAHTVQEVIGKTALRTVIVTGIGDMFPPIKGWVTDVVIRYFKRMIVPWQIEGAIKFKTALNDGKYQALAPVPRCQDDTAFLQYTGGTTGVPKGAMLTHGNMIANLQQISAWIGQEFNEGRETVVTALPLYHVFALTANLLTFLKWGGHNVLITNPRDVPRFVKELRTLRFTVITGVNTLFKAMMNDAGIRRVDTGALKVAVAGGMAVQRDVARKWMKLTGKPLIEGYGLTEASPLVIANRLDANEYSGMAGLPVPSTEVTFRDDEDNELPLGRIGELWVRGPQVMKGYWQRPRETAEVLSDEGWLRTGDMGFMDDRGYIKITDRKKDMIVVSGFKVFPNEIEEVVVSHPGVLEAAAVGVSDDRSGEAVKIVVVKKDPALTAEALIAFCAQQLTAYKVPKFVQFRDTALPKSAIGKPLRRLIRDQG